MYAKMAKRISCHHKRTDVTQAQYVATAVA